MKLESKNAEVEVPSRACRSTQAVLIMKSSLLVLAGSVVQAQQVGAEACVKPLTTPPQLMHTICDAAWVQVPAEIAAMVRRRTLSMVEIPAALAAAMEDAMRAGTRASSKQQRLESQQLLGTLRQLSRSRSRGGSRVLPDTDADVPAPVASLRGSRARGDEVSTMPAPSSFS